MESKTEAKGINFSEIPQTAIRVLASPSAFFKTMPKTGGFIEPLIFMVAMGVIGGLLQSIFGIIGIKLAVDTATGLTAIIIMPITTAIVGFIGAAILFVIWKLMGSQESYETAYRCAAYASAVTPITTTLWVIPYVGGVIGTAISTYLIVIASIEVHSIPSKKAWLVFGIIGSVFALLGLRGEFEAKRLQRESAEFQQQMQEASEMMQKQAEQMQKASEMMQKEAEQMQKSSEDMISEMQKKIEEAQKAIEKQIGKDK